MSAERPTGLDLLAAATAFLLPVAYLPIVDAPFWSPKVAVLLPAAAVGLTCIPALLRTELRKAALAALVFLLAASVSTALSEDVSQAVFGLYNAGTGLIFIWCLVGVWALGASVTEAGRKRVVLGLVAGIGISAAVGVVQVVVDLGVPFLGALVGSRSVGLAGNPVHLAALAIGVVALAATKLHERWWWLVPVGVGAAVIQLAGSRFALLLLPLVVLALLVWRGWRPATAALVCIILGLGVASNLPSAGGGDTSSTERLTLAASGGGVSVRLETWLSARHPIAEQPFFGEGPGRFRAATSPHRTLKVAKLEGPEALYEDAHNLGVEYLTTTGIVGLAALAAWLGLTLGRIRHVASAAFGVAMLALHVVQPQSVATTPLMMLVIGAATGGTAAAVPRARRPVTRAMAGLIGLAASATLLYGETQLQRARLDFDDAASRSAERLLRPWPAPASVRARLFLFEALQDPKGSALAEALFWREEAIRRAPDAPSLWNALADDEREAGSAPAASRHYGEALLRNPWSLRAARGLLATNVQSTDSRSAAQAHRVISELG